MPTWVLTILMWHALVDSMRGENWLVKKTMLSFIEPISSTVRKNGILGKNLDDIQSRCRNWLLKWQNLVISQSEIIAPGGHLLCNVYTCMTTEAWKKGCFLRMDVNCGNRNKGIKSTCFQGEGSFFTSNSILLNGYFRLEFCLGGKIWQRNRAKFLFRGVFPQNGKSLLGYLWSHTRTHCKLECPPGRYCKKGSSA